MTKILIALLACIALGAGCRASVPLCEFTGGTRRCSIEHDGMKRTFLIHVPKNLDRTRPVPLLIVLHGVWGTGERIANYTQHRFEQLADRDGFIVVYPDGIQTVWNDSQEDLRHVLHKNKIDDAGFICSLIDGVSANFKIDPKRVYAAGMSNGGMMSYRLAFDAPDRIAAVAAVSSLMPRSLSRCEAPACPIPIIIMNGSEDPVLPGKGARVKLGSTMVVNLLSIGDTIDYWVRHNGCSIPAIITNVPDSDPKDFTRANKIVYGGGTAGSEVVVYYIEGGGHSWPDANLDSARLFIGRTSHDFNACDVIWEFFKRHPKP